MKFDPEVMARMQAATRELMKNGPLAATAALQRTLGGNAPSDAVADHAEDAAPGATMKDLNPPPDYARPAAKAKAGKHADGGADSARQAPREENGKWEAPAAQGIADMLAKAGIRMPDAGAWQGPAAPDIAELLAKAGIKMPEADTWQAPDIAEMLKKAGIAMPDGLQNANLPGAKNRPPAPPLPDGARFESATFTCQAGTRSYKLYVPSTYSSEKPASLVVMLHGCTQDPDDFAAGTRMNQVAEETGALVAYPAQTQQANSSRCWNWFNQADQQHDRGEPAIIAGIARQVMQTYAIDAGRVSIAGLSAGGAMAVIVGALYPDLFSAVGVHSGLPFGSASDLPSALMAMKQGMQKNGKPVRTPPLIVFHGDKDQTVHAVNGEQVLQHGLDPHRAGTAEIEHGKATGGRKYTRSIHRSKDGSVLAEHWVLHGGGHSWAGGSASGSYTDGTGPDASREMVRFFQSVARTTA